MPQLTAQIAAEGPIIDLVIGVSAPRAALLSAQKLPLPKPIPVRGLLDTGASGTAVDKNVIRQLSLAPTGSVNIHTHLQALLPFSATHTMLPLPLFLQREYT